MSSLNQMRSVVELTNEGWEVVRFPDPKEALVLGQPTYMANADKQMIVVDATGNAYPIDITLSTAQLRTPVYTGEHN